MSNETLDTRITIVINELNKRGNWVCKHTRTLDLLEEDIRLNIKRFMQDPVNHKLDFTSGKIKVLISKLKSKVNKLISPEVILTKLYKETVIDDKVFDRILKPYIDIYFPLAIWLQERINRLTYLAVTLELYEQQDTDACFLESAILSAVRKA